MKHLLFLAFLFVNTNVSKAQSYQPFPVSYGMWCNQLLDDFWQPTNDYRIYRLEGDTLINTYTYKKIFMWGYHGALREKNKIVYYLPADSSNEHLLYNFNLNIGDSLFNSYTEYGIMSEIDTLSVFDIDSVLCEDGNYHKQYRIGNPATMGNGGEYIIEGIGSIHGLLTPMYVGSVSGGPRLNCAFGDSGMLYQLSGAFCYTAIKEQSISETIHIFPNPAQSTITINSSQLIHSVSFYNMAGITVSSTRNTNNEKTIAIEDFPNGIYNAVIQLQNGSLIHSKVVVCR